MPPPSETPDGPVLVQWIFDTRTWYPQVTQTKQLETHAARALALLPPSVTPQILRYYYARDAKMALASALLKHYAVSKLTPTPWSLTVATGMTRDERTKPVYVDPATDTQPVVFNVSHQDGVVALIAVANYPPTEKGEPAVDVGVDVVCTSERRARDRGMLASDGWPAFVDMHADVLAPGEARYLKYRVLDAVPDLVPQDNPTDEQVNDGRLRAFYALWALREAYVKLTGHALLADWLRELEFRDFRPPRPTAGWGVPAREEDGEVVKDTAIWFQGKRVEDVNMCLSALGPDFMIATAVRTAGKKEDGLGWQLGPYEVLSLDEVLDFAEGSRF